MCFPVLLKNFSFIVFSKSWPCPLWWSEPHKRKVHPGSQNVIIFGVKVFANVIKMKISRDNPELKWVLNPMPSFFVKDRKGE